MGTSAFDPLWVPVLTHYDASPETRLDRARTAAHLRHISPHVRQYLIAGTTGDGWQMPSRVLEDWLDLARNPNVLSPEHTVLFGAFAATTEAVIARAQAIENAIGDRPPAATYAGLTVCAPIAAAATQNEIVQHFERILDATTSPIAIYQLPQVVQCEIAPETCAALAKDNPRITLFKDTSGKDAVATSGVTSGSTRLLRGAEGDYAGHLKSNGPYDGWLLSTANSLAPQLRAIAGMVAAGQQDDADAASKKLTTLVEGLFAAADGLPSGNPFSNANRAVDHIMAHGANWRTAPARLASGDQLPDSFLQRVETLLQNFGLNTQAGYRP